MDRGRLRVFWFFLADLLVIHGSLLLAGWLRFGSQASAHWGTLFEAPWLVYAAYLALFTLIVTALRAYDTSIPWSLGRELSFTVQCWLLLGFFTTAMIVSLKLEGISRIFLATFFLLQLSGFILTRLIARWWYGRQAEVGQNVQRAVIVGTGPLGDEVARRLAQRSDSGLLVVGCVTDDSPRDRREPSVPVLGKLSDLRDILVHHVVDMVIVALAVDQWDRISWIVEACEEQGKDIRILLDPYETSMASYQLDTLLGIPALSYRVSPGKAFQLMVKRIKDVIASSVLLVLLSPVFAVIALAIKLEDGGPVFFKQRRVGLHGREFIMYKFRSMVVNAEAMLESLRDKNEVDGPVFKIRHDPRITRVGRFLRKTSLDELPQLWNVLKGEMSLVGPRPPLPSEVAQYAPWQRRRLSVKPGLTCTWQVEGRNQASFEEWVRMDLEYIDRWGLWLDIKLLFKTIPAVLRGTGM